jgi:hypothetical protein
MREELVVALEERVAQLIERYQQLHSEHTALQSQVRELVVKQQLASERIDALLQTVQSS